MFKDLSNACTVGLSCSAIRYDILQRKHYVPKLLLNLKYFDRDAHWERLHQAGQCLM